MSAFDKTFVRAVDLQWQKQAELEPQIQDNFLADLLQVGDFKEKAFTKKWMSPVEGSGIPQNIQAGVDTGPATWMRPNTPAAIQPTFSQRMSGFFFRPLKIDANRIGAKYLGMDVDGLAALFVQAYRAQRNKLQQEIMVRLMTNSFTEIYKTIATQTTAQTNTSGFGYAQNYFPGLQAGAGANRPTANLSKASLYALFGQFCDLNKMRFTPIYEEEIGIEDVKSVAIFSNAGWAAFCAYNSGQPKAEWDGECVKIGKYGKFPQFHGTIILVLPTDALPSFKATLTSYANQRPPNWGDMGEPPKWTLNKVVESSARGFLKASAQGTAAADAASLGVQRTDGGIRPGLHYGLWINPKTLAFKKAAAYPDEPQGYEDQSKGLERSIFGNVALEGIRGYDNGVQRFFFGDPSSTQLPTYSGIA